ncbi:MAG TPA: alkaline phosphatase D family protein [Caulobacteraceae bacterium]|jgi:alkaline phosphatase D|nr:alkaline phosphatase D family protein [Caulobacteraceae bacterium]
MAGPSRREFVAIASAFGAALAFTQGSARASSLKAVERRDLYPEGVASGDPRPDSVILWTRRPPVAGAAARSLTCEVAQDPAFKQVVATSKVTPSGDADWTVRVLAAGLKPAREYFYRFVDDQGFASRVGRTLTTPADDDDRPVRFAFASCQMVPAGACNAYRRMIFEDEQAPPDQRLGFVLHLGDFVYEIVWYPEDRAQYYARTLRDVVRYPHGEKITNFHVPTDVDDYRALYKGYLSDPDLQDARARFPFVCMWDNHEFSWKGFQGLQVFDKVRAAQTRKVAACQAWFEYQPARVVKTGGDVSLDRFVPPKVVDAPVTTFDANGLGEEPNNILAIHSLTIYRAFRYGKNVDLILTDNRSYRGDAVADSDLMAPFDAKDFPFASDQNAIEILDAGKRYDGGKPPETIAFGGQQIPNLRRDAEPMTMLGVKQKVWFLDRLGKSKAAWKIWGNPEGSLDWRVDFQNLPPELGLKWPGAGFATMGGDDWSGYFAERAEILDFVKTRKIGGFVSVAGDRHAFFAGVHSKSLPPRDFEPVALDFVGASISSPGLGESITYNAPKDSPIRAVYVYAPADGAPVRSAADFTVRHGVRSALELQRTHDREAALKLRNPDLSPHLSFLDSGAHGYAVVTAAPDTIDVEFVSIPRPLIRNTAPGGGPIAYRVAHRAALWAPGEAPKLVRTKEEGEMPLGA